ncbi:MAG: nuclear transport factor 2 family protein [Gemmatimonadota bacterium]
MGERAREEPLRELMRDFLAAWEEGDAAKAASFYTLDGVYLPANHPAVVGRHAIEKYHRSTMERLRPTWRVEPEEVLREHDLAVERGSYTVSVRPEGKEPTNDVGKYMIVCVRERDGQWRIKWDIDNSDTPIAIRPE